MAETYMRHGDAFEAREKRVNGVGGEKSDGEGKERREENTMTLREELLCLFFLSGQE